MIYDSAHGRCEGPARRKGEGSSVDGRDSVSQGRVEEVQRNGAGEGAEGTAGGPSVVGSKERGVRVSGLLTGLRIRKAYLRGLAVRQDGVPPVPSVAINAREKERAREGGTGARERGRREAQREEEGNYYTHRPNFATAVPKHGCAQRSSDESFGLLRVKRKEGKKKLSE